MSGFPGFGVMIQSLGGNADTVAAVKESLGKKIASMSLEDNTLHIRFTDESAISVRDSGQSCCESRYMSTDDNLLDYVGATLITMELRDAPDMGESEYGERHEVQFFVLITDKGNVTFANHNEHNGWYGGFWIEVSKESAA